MVSRILTLHALLGGAVAFTSVPHRAPTAPRRAGRSLMNVETPTVSKIALDGTGVVVPTDNAKSELRLGPNDLNVQAGDFAYQTVSGWAKTLVQNDASSIDRSNARVSLALQRMQRDMSMLDEAAGATPQLSNFEVTLLSFVVATAFGAPYLFPEKVVEVAVPAMAALAAATGFSAEYTGKVAVSRGKEIAATTLMAAAEAEATLAQAERAKAIIPLCVGFSATIAAFALLAPALVADIASRGFGMQLVTEVYLICPILGVLAAAVAALAAQETNQLSLRAIGIGSRRFANAEEVGRDWLSASEQVALSTKRSKEKWASFSLGVLPAPALAVLCPGALSFKAIVAAAVAAAQCAYSLAVAEYRLADAVDSVAAKTRAAAVSDTYANQGARAGSILPFTSAISGLCAATSVAIVEVLPLLGSQFAEALVCVSFPALGSLIAAAASISKARCEVDAEAASSAATQLADSERGGRGPIRSTLELVRLTISNGRKRVVQLPGKLAAFPAFALQWLVLRVRQLSGGSGTPAAA